MKPLPEEKLLKLIRGKAHAAAPAAATAAVPPGAGDSGMKRSSAVARARSLMGSRLLIVGLGVLLLIELILLAVQAVRPPPTVTVPEPAAVSGQSSEDTETPLPTMPSLAQSVSRPLFASPADVPQTESSGPRQAPSGLAKTVAARLTLLGIIAGNPGQAIIEDSQTKKTQFVSPGQAVAEGAVVDQVLDNRVILDLQGEKIELSL